ncbi:MAG: ABC transporter permease subunit [Pseudomonadota bacterium]
MVQAVVVGALLLLLAWLAANTIDNLRLRGITVGFDFLSREARFSISDTVLPYSPADTFAWAFLVGLCNTLFLSAIVAVASTLLGFCVALGRRSSHPLSNLISTIFVDTVRNIPVLVLLLFVYSLIIFELPDPVTARVWHGFFLNNRGFYGPALSWIGSGLHWSFPHMGHFNIDGGWIVSPELAAAVAGLTIYSTAFSAEIIRGGIDAVYKGQWEAGRALGLADKQVLRLVILPQALRVIVPPMTSQYVIIVKNSTLALMVGYAEINFVTSTTINQTGQAVEGTAILMTVFLVISLMASWLMNILNRRYVLVEH